MTKQTMGEMIASLRKERGMTQKDLADKMSVTDKAVSKWERNLSCPDVNSIPRLAETLGVSVEELINAAPGAQEERQDSGIRKTIDLILRAVPVGMGTAVVVLSAMDQLEVKAGFGALGIGVMCIGLYLLRQDEK